MRIALVIVLLLAGTADAGPLKRLRQRRTAKACTASVQAQPTGTVAASSACSNGSCAAQKRGLFGRYR